MVLLAIAPSIDWSAINTALIVATGGYMWRQTRMVDQLRQALLGMDGAGGALEEIKMLRTRSHELAGAIQKLNGSVENLTHEMQTLQTRQPGEERRRS